MDEFNIYFNEAKLSTGMINGRTALSGDQQSPSITSYRTKSLVTGGTFRTRKGRTVAKGVVRADGYRSVGYFKDRTRRRQSVGSDIGEDRCSARRSPDHSD